PGALAMPSARPRNSPRPLKLAAQHSLLSPHAGPELLTSPAGMLNPGGRADVLLNANPGLTAWLPGPRIRRRPSQTDCTQARDTRSHPDSIFPEGTITDDR